MVCPKQLPHPKHVINFLGISAPLMLKADYLSQYTIDIKFPDSCFPEHNTCGVLLLFLEQSLALDANLAMTK